MKKITHYLYFWVLLAIVSGALIGYFCPDLGVSLKPLGDGFISLIKMLIAPLIFSTVVLGIAGAEDGKKVGRVGLKAILYFEVVSTLALGIGLLIVNILKPGANFIQDPAQLHLDTASVSEYAQKAHEQNFVDFALHMIPKSLFDIFTSNGDILQVLLVALLFGYALHKVGDAGKPLLRGIDSLSQVIFKIINLIMKLAPLGAGGAMAFTIGKYGIASLRPLFSLMLCFYLACILFVIFVLGVIAHYAKFNIFRLVRYLKEELLLVLGTSSSESGLAPLMEKLEKLGCKRGIVGLVVPAGYSFNLDGTNIYLSMAAIFVAQALHIPLTLTEQLSILGIAILTSKGASGVTGAGFITLAATLTIVPKIPVAGLAIILGVDRFMSEARALTNIVGNAVATIVIAGWEKELDLNTLNRELRLSPSGQVDVPSAR